MRRTREFSTEPNVVDIHVGQRIKLRRIMMGLSQDDLAKQCGVSFQQIQKYEVAGNRISASRLFQIGNILNTPVAFFFEGLPNQIVANSEFAAKQKLFKDTKIGEPKIDDPLAKNESLRLLNLFWKLPSDDARQSVFVILEQMCKK